MTIIIFLFFVVIVIILLLLLLFDICVSIQVASVVGGLSLQKQQRVLESKPEIVVATPGRLWELIQQRHAHLNHLEGLRYLVIDEADRMVSC